ncbi:hypothetical protein [Acinetobacter nosocomialis]|uniref:hypothetical protein n=1 Tax=Acinetobacter nosocomialis TaxID=106654 RepID=UPI0033A10B46
MNNEELAKIGSMFVDWIQVHRNACNRFEDFKNCFDTENPNDPIYSKSILNEAYEVQKEACVLAADARAKYNTLLEEVDLYLARERTDVLEGNLDGKI